MFRTLDVTCFTFCLVEMQVLHMLILALKHIFVVTLFVFGPRKKTFRDSDKTVFLFSDVFSQSIEMTLFVTVTFFVSPSLSSKSRALQGEERPLFPFCLFSGLALSSFLPSFLSFFSKL